MKINLTLFETLTPQKFAAERRFFCIKEAGGIFDRFVVFVANALGHAMVHGDVTHVNNVLSAARAMRQYRLTQRMTQGLIPFKYDKKTEQFVGKADSAKLAKLRKVITEKGVSAPRWEFLLTQKLGTETSKRKADNKKDYDLSADVVRLYARAETHGLTHQEVLAECEKAA